MNRLLLVAYGAIAYLCFNVAFVYMIGFLLDLFVPKAINDGASSPIALAIFINLGLVFLFGFFHSLMARESFKAWWTKLVPADAERSTYVLQSALFLGLAMWQWQAIPQTIWAFEGALAWAAYLVCALGVACVLTSTFLIDHFELFGLRQVWAASTRRPMPQPKFVTPFLYRFVRHPMQLGVVMVLFGTPHMTLGHLVFATSMTLYILIGLWFEERALLREFGDAYRAYQRHVPMLVPRLTPVSRDKLSVQAV